MRALVYEGPKTLAMRDRDMPEPKAGEALVRVESVGICGSDMHGYLGHDPRRPAPLILGHEAAGIVESGTQKGKRVTLNPLVGCGTCPACLRGAENVCPDRQIISMPPREGAFAQYVTIPEKNMVEVPDNVPLSKAALVEPLAVSWHTVRMSLAALHPQMQRSALVLGGGAIGLAAALALRAMGVEDITIAEPNPARARFLEETCGEKAVAKAEGQFAIIIDAVGIAATRATASHLALPGGVIGHIGLGDDGAGGLDARRMTLQEITFIGTYTYTMDDFRDTAQALYEGKLGDIGWTEERALTDGAEAFADLHSGKVAAPKIVLFPWA